MSGESVSVTLKLFLSVTTTFDFVPKGPGNLFENNRLLVAFPTTIKVHLLRATFQPPFRGRRPVIDVKLLETGPLKAIRNGFHVAVGY